MVISRTGKKDNPVIRGGPDALHLTEADYRIWADTMQPVLDGMMRSR